MKSAAIVSSLMFVMLMVVGNVCAQQSKVFYVSPSVNRDGNNCEDRNNPCRTIEKALGFVDGNRGDTIILLDGGKPDSSKHKCEQSYDSVTIAMSVTIRADDRLKNKPCFDGMKKTPISTIRSIPKSVILTIIGVQFINSVSSVGVSFSGGKQLIVKNCDFGSSLGTGITFNNSVAKDATLTVSDSNFKGAFGIGFDAFGLEKGLELKNCDFEEVTTASVNISQSLGNRVIHSYFHFKKVS